MKHAGVTRADNRLQVQHHNLKKKKTIYKVRGANPPSQKNGCSWDKWPKFVDPPTHSIDFLGDLWPGTKKWRVNKFSSLSQIKHFFMGGLSKLYSSFFLRPVTLVNLLEHQKPFQSWLGWQGSKGQTQGWHHSPQYLSPEQTIRKIPSGMRIFEGHVFDLAFEVFTNTVLMDGDVLCDCPGA